MVKRTHGAGVARVFFLLASLVLFIVGSVGSPSTANDDDDGDNLVVVLTGGLRWPHLDLENYPNLSQLAENGTIASLVPMPVSGVACPFDSWLEMSATRQVYPTSQSLITCPTPDVHAGYPIAFWGQSAQARAVDSTVEIERTAGAMPGIFAETLDDHGVDSQAIGTGGAYILAPSNGIVPEDYIQAPSEDSELAGIVGNSASNHQLTVVDADTHSYNRDIQRESSQRKTENQTLLAQGLPPKPDPHSAPEDETDAESNGVIDSEETPTPAPEFPEGGSSFEDAVRPLDTVDLDENALRHNYETSRDAMREELTEENATRVDAVLGGLPDGTDVIVASLVGFGNERTMQIALSGTVGGPAEPGVGTSATTRQTGIIHQFDLAPTILEKLNVEDPIGTSGAPLRTERGADLDSRLELMDDRAAHTDAMASNRGLFLRSLTHPAIGYFALTLLAMIQPVYRRTLAHRPVRKVWSWFGLTLAAVPVSSLFINLLDWWSTSHPSLALVGGSWLLAGGLALISMNLQRLHQAAPLLFIGGLTAATLLVDTATGSHMMADSPMGFNTLTAARFYGLGNEAYALLATGALVVLSFLGVWIRRRFGSWQAMAAVGILGLIVAIVDAMPSMGADFGGALSFLPALIVLMLMIGRIRISWGKAIGIGALTVAAAAAIAFVDWMRPVADQTHLGRFMNSAIHGELWEILFRKLGTNIRLLFGSTHRFVALAALLLLLLVLLHVLRKRAVIDSTGAPIDRSWRPTWWNYLRMSYLASWGWLAPTQDECRVPDHATESSSDRDIIRGSNRVRDRFPALQPALVSIAVCITLAFALNDSGIVLPGMAAILLVPLLTTFVLREQTRREAAAS